MVLKRIVLHGPGPRGFLHRLTQKITPSKTNYDSRLLTPLSKEQEMGFEIAFKNDFSNRKLRFSMGTLQET